MRNLKSDFAGLASEIMASTCVVNVAQLELSNEIKPTHPSNWYCLSTALKLFGGVVEREQEALKLVTRHVQELQNGTFYTSQYTLDLYNKIKDKSPGDFG